VLRSWMAVRSSAHRGNTSDHTPRDRPALPLLELFSFPFYPTGLASTPSQTQRHHYSVLATAVVMAPAPHPNESCRPVQVGRGTVGLSHFKIHDLGSTGSCGVDHSLHQPLANTTAPSFRVNRKVEKMDLAHHRGPADVAHHGVPLLERQPRN
jgi:hypothetical protein